MAELKTQQFHTPLLGCLHPHSVLRRAQKARCTDHHKSSPKRIVFGLSGMKTDCSNTDEAGGCPGSDGTVLSMGKTDRKLKLSVQELQSQQSSLYTHHKPLYACVYQGGHSRTSKCHSVSGSVLSG